MIPRPTPEDLVKSKVKANEEWEYRKKCHAFDCKEPSLGKNDLLCRKHKANLGVYSQAYAELCSNLVYEEVVPESVVFGFGSWQFPKYVVTLSHDQAFSFLAIQSYLKVLDLEKELDNSKARERSAESNAHCLAGQVSRLRNL